MHIKDLLADTKASGKPSFSFEYFPPKTSQGVQNLYDRMDRMYNFGPQFIDITWGAGGRIAELTCEMVLQAQAVYGLETCMHLTCTDMGLEKVNDALHKAYKAGCTNILALRGDPPRAQEKWTATEDGFQYACDLVKHIRATYGDHFDIGVAGYPEGCDDNDNEDELIEHLKYKVDLGGTFIVTQMFYDVDNFIRWVGKVRAAGITVPILPGIMPIATYASFIRRCKHTGCNIPQKWLDLLDPVKNDDVAVREIGKTLVVEMCRKLMAAGIHHMHFYTMNLAQATRMVLEELEWTPSAERPLQQALPWKPSKGFGRRDEDVRPIFWRNRKKSYVLRTQDWDEFPNGRWGDSRSPAFGELDAYGIGLTGTNEANRQKWGEPKSLRDIANTFVRYLNQELDSLPWSEAPLTGEADPIKAHLIELNQRGFLTINSQPAVDGVKSSHPSPPQIVNQVIRQVEANPTLTYYAVTKDGPLKTNAPSDGPNAVTWGVFPGKEIVQPTIVESISFLAWRDEAFRLGVDWAHCFEAKSPSRVLIESVMNDWYLLNIVNNDFHDNFTIFELFKDLQVDGLDTPVTVDNEAAPDAAVVAPAPAAAEVAA
ncbi:hypothetical protein NQ176_g4616 [Zarea fungicola]|uniref:Uncharacterized protein n=1 Tax=Zarea fungicola TaxID=93591 RepID=A0ACC1NDA2_9HYPO|nr:hypothetical protein NQ176_g4616 [Lecanicillium fungicola]